jgi:hypothetical protein
MNTVYLKIVDFDENTKSLLVSFASDTTKSQDPANYETLAYQPYSMWPDVTDVTELPKLLAAAGAWQAQQQENKEKLLDNPQVIEQYRSLVGQQFSFDTTTLFPNIPTTE